MRILVKVLIIHVGLDCLVHSVLWQEETWLWEKWGLLVEKLKKTEKVKFQAGAACLREVMDAENITPADLAARLSITVGHVYAIRDGRANLTKYHLQGLQEILLPEQMEQLKIAYGYSIPIRLVKCGRLM